MKDRLQEILKNEKLTPARFAELAGVQRSSVSHILSGRNKPSLDFLQKILANFEHINPEWLLTGKGHYKRLQIATDKDEADTNDRSSGKIVFPENNPVREEEKVEYKLKNDSSRIENHNINTNKTSKESSSNQEQTTISPSNHKKIVKTILFYDDHTFEVFWPNA